MTELRTDNLVLRPCSPGDREDFISLERDAEVMRFLNGGAVDHQRTRPDDVTFLMPRGTEPEVWTARRPDDGAFVGWFCLFDEGDGRAEIGYRLHRDAWGQGLASEGAAALIGWGFANAGCERIVACTMAVNHASRRVMEKVGMRYTHTDHAECPVPIEGSDAGEVWYELTRSAWAERQAQGGPACQQ